MINITFLYGWIHTTTKVIFNRGYLSKVSIIFEMDLSNMVFKILVKC